MAHVVPVSADLPRATTLRPRAGFRSAAPSLALVAGALVVAGVVLPWVSTFAGLVSMSGTATPNGRVLLALGALTLVAAVLLGVRGDVRARWAIGLLGFVTLLYGGHLLIELFAALRTADGMALAAVGPGLPVCLVGGLAALGTLLLPSGAQARADAGATPGARTTLRTGGLRYAAATAATVAAAAHIPVTPQHLREAPYLGIGFLALTATLLILASALLTSDARWLWLAVGGVCAAALLAYVASRSVGLPDLGGDVGNWLEPLGVVSVISESVAAGLALVALRRR